MIALPASPPVPSTSIDATLGELLWSEQATVVSLPCGAMIHVRPLRVTDEKALQDLFSRLSEESSYERFLSHKSRDIRENVTGFFESAEGRDAAFVAVSDDKRDEIVAMASYAADSATGRADISLVVRDDWQSRGVGTVLFRRLVTCARERGLQGFTADVLATNSRMLALFHDVGLQVESQLDAGVYHVNAALR